MPNTHIGVSHADGPRTKVFVLEIWGDGERATLRLNRKQAQEMFEGLVGPGASPDDFSATGDDIRGWEWQIDREEIAATNATVGRPTMKLTDDWSVASWQSLAVRLKKFAQYGS